MAVAIRSSGFLTLFHVVEKDIRTTKQVLARIRVVGAAWLIQWFSKIYIRPSPWHFLDVAAKTVWLTIIHIHYIQYIVSTTHKAHYTKCLPSHSVYSICVCFKYFFARRIIAKKRNREWIGLFSIIYKMKRNRVSVSIYEYFV